MKAGPRQSEFEPHEGKTVKFSDVHGVDEAKEVGCVTSTPPVSYASHTQELQDVVEFLKNPAAFSTLGGKLPNGVLLTGFVFSTISDAADLILLLVLPGRVKPCLQGRSRAKPVFRFSLLLGELEIISFEYGAFVNLLRSDFDEMFVGVGAKRVRELFAAARKREPAIIFIDELDAVGGKRSHRDQQYMKQTLNQLLTEMDGFEQSEGVIVIAATNFPESLDQSVPFRRFLDGK